MPTLLIGRDRHDGGRAEPDQPRRLLNGGVCVGTGDDSNPRRSLQSLCLDVPADPPQHLVSRRRQRSDVRHRRTGDEADAGAGRQRQEFEQPSGGDFFQCGDSWGHDVQRHVLIPRRDQPVGCNRCRHTAADDEAEVTRAGRPHQAGFDGCGEAVDNRGGVLRVIGQWTAECRDELGEGSRCSCRPVVEVFEKGAGEVMGAGQRVRHRLNVSSTPLIRCVCRDRRQAARG